jgi:arylsulfatase A-like enzyme
MNKKLAIFLISSYYGIAFAFCLSAAKLPNIVFIIADDLGYGELGCYGQEKIKTPSIDTLAMNGIRFTDHYSGYSTCTTSRMALMTGKHVLRHDAPTRNGERMTVAQLLQQSGYKTAMIGKWGMGGKPGHAWSPGRQGFDHVFTYDNQGFAHFYYPEFLWRNGEKVFYPNNHNLVTDEGYIKANNAGTYSHDEFTSEALQFIEDNKDGPFFLYLPYTIPHAELTVPEDSLEPYKKLNWTETERDIHPGGTKDPGYGSQYKNGYCRQKYPNTTYAAMVSRMDRDVGRIVNLLEELELQNDTLVIFTSDNGASAEGGQSMEFFQSSGPLREGKRSIYEGGTRVPFIAMWPGMIEPGTVTEHISSFCDFMATTAELTGVEAPSSCDGVSYLHALTGQGAQKAGATPVFYAWEGRIGVRAGEWKLVRMRKENDPQYELFNLKSDIGEQRNLATQMPEKVSLLDQALKPYLK